MRKPTYGVLVRIDGDLYKVTFWMGRDLQVNGKKCAVGCGRPGFVRLLVNVITVTRGNLIIEGTIKTRAIHILQKKLGVVICNARSEDPPAEMMPCLWVWNFWRIRMIREARQQKK